MRLRLGLLVTTTVLISAGLAYGENKLTIDFGDDQSGYPHDGECDDRRFAGDAMASPPWLEDAIGHDASDCRAAFEGGRLTLAPPLRTVALDDFGDDSGSFPGDGQCDDPRFTGKAVSLGADETHRGRDASDCLRGLEAGQLSWKTGWPRPLAPDIRPPAAAPFRTPYSPPPAPAPAPAPAPIDISAIDFGDNTSTFAHDGECDDGRFVGAGMTNTILLDSDIGHDADDCRSAMEAGQLRLKP